MIGYLIVLLIILGIMIWGGVTQWKFINKNSDYYENLQRKNDTEIPVLYINLLERTDRKKQIEEEMNKLGNVNLIRVDGPKTEKGALGCYLAHISALSIAEKANWPYVLICEDDFMWKDIKIARKVIKELIAHYNDWNIVLLACNGKGIDITTQLPIQKANKCGTTSGYLINKNYYSILKNFWADNLAYCSKNQLFNKSTHESALDVQWMKLQKKDIWYVTKPVLGKQRASYSDVEKQNVDYGV